jgi:hypothetical protein
MYQDLPRHPFIPFAEIFRELAGRYIRSPLARRLFLRSTRLWSALSGAAESERRVRDAFARGEDGHFERIVRAPYPFRPEICAALILREQEDKDPVRLAARLILGALRFRERAFGEQLEQEYEAGRPLDMRRYLNLFSRLIDPSLRQGRVVSEIIDAPASEHIIVATGGLFYRLTVSRNDQIVPAAELLAQLQDLVADAQEQLKSARERVPFGLLTALQNKSSVSLLAQLAARSPSAIRDLNRALFLIALDLDDSPQTLEGIGRSVLLKNYASRDYRRSMQIVVTASGQAGVITDPFAGIGGTLSARFVDELARSGRSPGGEPVRPGAEPAARAFVRLDLDTGLLSGKRRALAANEEELRSHSYPDGSETVFRLEGFGRKDFALLSASADGAFHAAFSLAFLRCFGRIPEVGNFINLRTLQHGDISRYNATTPELRSFVEAPDAASLAAALAAHKELIKRAKAGTDALYQLKKLMILFNRGDLGMLAVVSLMLLLMIFIRGFERRFLREDVLASNIPALPGVALTGRPGVRLSFLARPSLGGHYMMFDHHIVLCFVSNPGRSSYCGKEALFAAGLRESLAQVKQLLGPAPGP